MRKQIRMRKLMPKSVDATHYKNVSNVYLHILVIFLIYFIYFIIIFKLWLPLACRVFFIFEFKVVLVASCVAVGRFSFFGMVGMEIIPKRDFIYSRARSG